MYLAYVNLVMCTVTLVILASIIQYVCCTALSYVRNNYNVLHLRDLQSCRWLVNKVSEYQVTWDDPHHHSRNDHAVCMVRHSTSNVCICNLCGIYIVWDLHSLLICIDHMQNAVLGIMCSTGCGDIRCWPQCAEHASSLLCLQRAP